MSRERWPEILAKVADDYAKFQESAELLAANDPIPKDLIEKAQDSAERAQFAEADQFLIEAEAQEEAARDKIKEAEKKRHLNLVSLKAIRAQNYMVQQRYAQAADLYEKAAALAEGVDGEKQIEMLSSAADAFRNDGEENRNEFGLSNAIFIYKNKVLPAYSGRELSTAMGQYTKSVGIDA